MRHYTDKVRFHPWVGTNYGSRSIWGLSVLILGESHYDRNDELGYTDATQKTITKYVNGWSHQYYTKTTNAFLGRSGRCDNLTRNTFWQSIAFYNYVQTVVGAEPGQRPTEEMWGSSRKPFKEVLAVIKPDCILVVGKDLWSHLIIDTSAINDITLNGKTLQTGMIDSALVGVIKHVSKGFSPLDWHPLISQLIDTAKEQAKHVKASR